MNSRNLNDFKCLLELLNGSYRCQPRGYRDTWCTVKHRTRMEPRILNFFILTFIFSIIKNYELYVFDFISVSCMMYTCNMISSIVLMYATSGYFCQVMRGTCAHIKWTRLKSSRELSMSERRSYLEQFSPSSSHRTSPFSGLHENPSPLITVVTQFGEEPEVFNVLPVTSTMKISPYRWQCCTH